MTSNGLEEWVENAIEFSIKHGFDGLGKNIKFLYRFIYSVANDLLLELSIILQTLKATRSLKVTLGRKSRIMAKKFKLRSIIAIKGKVRKLII